MKKLLIIFAVLLSLFLYTDSKEEDYYIVPKESIRFRIIPNSNSLEDLFMKEKVKEEVRQYVEF